MRPCALTDCTDESIVMRVSKADGIVSTSREAPGYHFQGVEVVLVFDPVEDRLEQAVW